MPAVRFGSNSGEPNIQANRTLGVTVRLGSCSPGNEPDLCSVRTMFGSVRFGSPWFGSASPLCFELVNFRGNCFKLIEFLLDCIKSVRNSIGLTRFQGMRFYY